MNDLSDNQENIYLTSTNVKSRYNNKISLVNEKLPKELYIKSYKIKTPLILPSISRNTINKKSYNSYDLDKKPEISNLNSYFAPENYLEYDKSFNKYEKKLDPIIKDRLAPKNVLMRNRRYDRFEQNAISDLNRDEMIHRSLGQGMFYRILKYHQLNRKKPYKIIYTVDYNNNDKYIKKFKNNKKSSKKIIKDNKINESPKENIPLYLREKAFNPNNIEYENENEKPMNELLVSYKPPSFVVKKKISQNSISNQNLNYRNKLRDQKILMALIKSGDEELKFNIGPNYET
jgi:hypothetical protein